MKNKPLKEYSDTELDEMLEWASPRLQEGDIPWEALEHGDIVIFYPPKPWTPEPWIVQVLRKKSRFSGVNRIGWNYIFMSQRGFIRPWSTDAAMRQRWMRREEDRGESAWERLALHPHRIWANKYIKRWALWRGPSMLFINWPNEHPLEMK